MAITHSRRAASAISASTTSASATIGLNAKYIKVVNPTTALCYVTTGKGSATATSSFPAVGVYDSAVFEKPSDDDTVAVLLSTGTGTISVFTVDAP